MCFLARKITNLSNNHRVEEIIDFECGKYFYTLNVFKVSVLVCSNQSQRITKEQALKLIEELKDKN